MKKETLYRGDLMIGNDSTLLKKEKKSIKKRFFLIKLKIPIVRSQFVVQTYSIMAQRAQDNKFVESELENWVLVNLGNNYCKFKEDLN